MADTVPLSAEALKSIRSPAADTVPNPTVPRRKPPTSPSPARPSRTTAPEPTQIPSARNDRAQLRRAARARRRIERREVRRFTRRSRRRRVGWVVAAGLVVTLAAVIAVAAYSPLLALRTIEVDGASRVSPEAVATALDGQLGVPLPLVDFDKVKEGLAQFPLIGSYSTESRPPGTLVIRIIERQPVGVLQTATGFDLVDAAGVTVETETARIVGYPLINVAGGDVTSVAFASAAAVLTSLPAEVVQQVDSVSATTRDDVTLALTSGQRVVWGSADDSALKARILTPLLAQHPTNVTEYDVSSPSAVVLR